MDGYGRSGYGGRRGGGRDVSRGGRYLDGDGIDDGGRRHGRSRASRGDVEGRGWSLGGGRGRNNPDWHQDGQQWRLRGRGETHEPSMNTGSAKPESSRGGGRGRGEQVYAPLKPTSEPHDLDYEVKKMQEMEISEQAPDINNTKLIPLRRPDIGGELALKSVNLTVNHFPVQFNMKMIIYQYDVDVKRKEGPRKEGPLKVVKITKSELCKIREKLSSDKPREFPLLETVYDGERSIFSAGKLSEGTYPVSLWEGEDKKVFDVTITCVKTLELWRLKDYLSGAHNISIPREILHGLDIVMKENPTKKMIRVGGSFYPKMLANNDDLGNGVVASRGFQHSLKPTSQGLALCLDLSTLAFRKPLPVLLYLQQHIQGFKTQDFQMFQNEVLKKLKGLKVTVTHRITNHSYVIMGLTDLATKDLSFIEAGHPTTVVDYFLKKYGKDIIYKDIPCLNLGRGNNVPMEFCKLVEWQRYAKEDLDQNAARKLKSISIPLPKDRQNRIRVMLQADYGPCGGDISGNFHIEVDTNMTKVKGRVIEPPQLNLRDSNSKTKTITVGENCQWNLNQKHVVTCKRIERWAVIDFTTKERYNNRLSDQFISMLQRRFGEIGIHVAGPLVSESATMDVLSNASDLRTLLEKVIRKADERNMGRLQIVLCVMSRQDSGYKLLKFVSEIQLGVMTQCCLSSKANNERGQSQYLANLALKMNAKLGGSNVELKQFPLFKVEEDRVMFIGADVNHPSSQNRESHSISIAAVVATTNWPAANSYAVRIRGQVRRQEKIHAFGDMCLELVQVYAQTNNNIRPNKIVIFRDGVSEGQFDMVLNEELADIKRVFKSVDYSPTITLIVATKRHQTRLFPEDKKDGSENGNVIPGTVADTKIVHPFEFDFYLCSHYGNIGTSKPTHYYVLYDDHGFSSDQLQKLVFHMCFTFSRCTKAVSLVPPVYYADLAAYRGRMYLEALEASGSKISMDDLKFKLHANTKDMMFFV